MLDINPYGAFVADLALVESHLESGGGRWLSRPAPSVNTRNRKIDVPQAQGLVAVGVETAITVDVDAHAEGEPYFHGEYVVGCTVAAPEHSDSPAPEQRLVEYAVDVNIGFVRTLVYQQTLASQLPEPLVVPPMVFDGILDE